MVTLNSGKSGATVVVFSGGAIPDYGIIGVGSGADVATYTNLVTETGDRKIWSTLDMSTSQQAQWTFDWNSVEMSGVQLTEVGLSPSGASNNSGLWLRSSFPAVEFDGTNELQVEVTFEIF